MLKEFTDHPQLSLVFMQLGSALDDINESGEALTVYDDGIRMFPGSYLLYFNKGLTMLKLNRAVEGLALFQKSASLRPLHSSSNYYLGLLLEKTNKIPALLAQMTFLAVEPRTARSKDGLKHFQDMMGGNVKKDGKNTTIMIDPSMLGDKKKNAEDDFSTIELIFTLSAAIDNNKGVDSVFTSEADKLSLKLQLLINALDEGQKDGKGFYWKHYVPFFVAMKAADQVGTLAHLILMQSADDSNKTWLETHEDELNKFYDWMKGYRWN